MAYYPGKITYATLQPLTSWPVNSCYVNSMDLGANQISVAERILSLQDEWDQIAASPDTVSLTPVQRAELDKRITDHASSPTDVVPWEDVLRNLRQR